MISVTDNAQNVRASLSNANVFFHNEYAYYERNSGKEFFYCYSEKYIVPISITKKLIFKYARMESEPYIYNEYSYETEKAFLDDVCGYLEKNKIQWLMPSPASAIFDEVPSMAVKIPFGSHVINLESDLETLWSNVHSKHRNVIKKAEKEGVRIVKGISDEILNDYHSIDIETWGRSNIKVDGVNHLKKQVEAMGDNIIFYLAYKNDFPQAGAIFYYNQTMCYYMYGASRNHSFTGSSNLLHWIAIQDMKAAGVKSYSFVGCRINEDKDSKYHGIQRFKERFGGELKRGYMFKCIFDRKKRVLFELSYTLYNFFRTGRFILLRDIIDQELYKWK